MTTKAVHALPGEVLFHVEVMRQEMKTIKTAPPKEVTAAIEKMEEEINHLFEKASKAAEELAAEMGM
jgi:sugar-specific transcriptional regulator TrmB